MSSALPEELVLLVRDNVLGKLELENVALRKALMAFPALSERAAGTHGHTIVWTDLVIKINPSNLIPQLMSLRAILQKETDWVGITEEDLRKYRYNLDQLEGPIYDLMDIIYEGPGLDQPLILFEPENSSALQYMVDDSLLKSYLHHEINILLSNPFGRGGPNTTTTYDMDYLRRTRELMKTALEAIELSPEDLEWYLFEVYTPRNIERNEW
jgi:hypothetical protein